MFFEAQEDGMPSTALREIALLKESGVSEAIMSNVHQQSEWQVASIHNGVWLAPVIIPNRSFFKPFTDS